MTSRSRKLLLGTRGSDLALTQAGMVADALRARGIDIELRVIRTAGDRSSAPSFAAIGPQGVFVREIETALSSTEIDLAVHSYKDLPTKSPAGLVIGAVPARFDAADVLLVRHAALLGDAAGALPLARGAHVGTASARRSAWLRHLRGDLEIASLRGNVPTRIRRLSEGRYDAIVLAAAGLARLREASDLLEEPLADITILRLDPEMFVPAPSQGALAVQCRADDPGVVAALAAIDDAPSRAAVDTERTALARAEGGCDVAFGAYCTPSDGGYRLTTMLERGGRVYTATAAGSAADTLAEQGWQRLAEALE